MIFFIFANYKQGKYMEQKVILITGASAGIGLATAQLLMDKGMKVYAASRRGGENVKSAKNTKGEIVHVKMDVNNEDTIQETIRQIIATDKKLDVVICNAGNGIAGSVEDSSSDEVKYQFETNFFGSVKTIQACLPVFRSQGYGKILATSSVAAIVPIPFQAFYSSGKAALLVFMQALAMELKPFGIDCCTILPGDTKTEFTNARKYTIDSQASNSAYSSTMKKSISKMEKDEENGVPALNVAQVIAKQIMKKKMSVTVVPGIDYKIIVLLFRVLPRKVSLWIVGLIYG